MSDTKNPFAGNGQGAPPSGFNSGAATTADGRPVAPPETMTDPRQSRAQNPDAKPPSIEDIVSQIGANLPQRPNGSESTIDPMSVRPEGRVYREAPGKASTVAASAIGRDQQPRPFKNLR